MDDRHVRDPDRRRAADRVGAEADRPCAGLRGRLRGFHSDSDRTRARPLHGRELARDPTVRTRPMAGPGRVPGAICVRACHCPFTQNEARRPPAGRAPGRARAFTLKGGPWGRPVARWVPGAAAGALPPAADSGPVSATGRVWNLPPIPSASLASNVSSFDPSITQSVADKMAHDVALDLIIEAEARRSHDLKLAELGARDDGLKEFTDVMSTAVGAGQI